MPARERHFPAKLAKSASFRKPDERTSYRSAIQNEFNDALLNAAEKLFAEKGMWQTNMHELGAMCGLPPYAVRAHFGNKDLILQNLLDRHIDRLIDRTALCEAFNEESDPVARLRLAIHGLLEALNTYRYAQLVHTAGSCAASPQLVRSLRLRQRHLAHYYAGLIAAAVPGVEGETELAMPLAMSLMAMACWHVLWFRDGGAIHRDEYAGLLTHMLVAGGREAVAEGIGALAAQK